MPTTREQVAIALAVHDPEVLSALLEAARVPLRGAESPRELADRIADALWWTYSTPLGYFARNATLEEITRHVARRLGAKDQVNKDLEAWAMLRQLTEALAIQMGPVSVDDLDPVAQKRLRGSWAPTAAWAGGSGSSFGGAWVGKAILRLGKGPVGRLLPWIPYVGPAWRVIHKGGGVAAVLGGPLGIAMGTLALNSALGANYKRLVPLLLGVGALGPGPVEDAEEL